MRTIKETAWLILDGDGLTHQYLEDSQTTHILEIEIDVSDDKDKVILEAIMSLLPEGKSKISILVAQAIEFLKPRPPRATIREAEK